MVLFAMLNTFETLPSLAISEREVGLPNVKYEALLNSKFESMLSRAQCCPQ
jgi:hypothetical protein